MEATVSLLGERGFDRFTVQEETIDDALAAVALLRRTTGVDTNRVFVLGHSLGAMLVPRIGMRDTNIAGFILLSAPSTSSGTSARTWCA